MTEQEYELELERRDAVEHSEVIKAIASIIKTNEGRKLFRYLFNTFGAVDLPPEHMEGNILHEYLGHLRTGNAIFKIACEADYETSAIILSKLEREKYDRLYEEHRIKYESNSITNDGERY